MCTCLIYVIVREQVAKTFLCLREGFCVSPGAQDEKGKSCPLSQLWTLNDAELSQERSRAFKLTANVSNVRRASVETKEEYKQKVEDELERSASQVQEWEGKIAEADLQTRAQREEQLEALRHIQDIARSELEQLEKAEGEAWHAVKARLDGVLSELRSALSNASNKFF
jgi:hypothetical protein